MDRAGLVGGVQLSAEPDRGIGDGVGRFVEDREHVSGRAGADQVSESTLADEHAAALAVANEVDDPGPASLQLGKLKPSQQLSLRRLAVGECPFEVWDQSVEVDVGVQFTNLVAVVVQRIEFEDLDDQRVDVLDFEFERNVVVGVERGGIGGDEVDIDSFLQQPVLPGSEQRGELCGVALSGQDLRFGEDLFEVVVREVGSERLVAVFFAEEVFQVLANQGFVVANDGQPGGDGVVGLQVGEVSSVGEFLENHGADVGHVPRQLDVVEKCLSIVHSPVVVEPELSGEHVCFERVVDGVESSSEVPEPVEVVGFGGGVVSPIGVVVGLQFREVGGDEVGLVEQCGLEFKALVELSEQQLAVDAERPETTAP